MDESLREKWEEAKQGHIIQFYEALLKREGDGGEKKAKELLNDIKTVDLKQVESMYQSCQHLNKQVLNEIENIKPLKETIKLKSDERYETWKTLGYELIGTNKIGVILLAGGQGTRLGYPHPKGMYVIPNLPSKKSLFQLQAEKLLRLIELTAKEGKNEGKTARIVWYIMTSNATHEETVMFFEENHYFGYKAEDVVFFQQSTLPCTSLSGELLLSSPCSINAAPNGNGGVYAALLDNKILDHMSSNGIEIVFTYGVDNVLAKIADPAFIGCFKDSKAEVGSKVVPKRSPEEKVGVFCYRNNHFDIVEYSELPKELAELRDQNSNELLFNAANIVTHIFTVEFLKTFARDHLYDLKYHLALKDIPSLDLSSGEIRAVKGYKYEQFIFDAFSFAEKLLVCEVNREDEFSAVKNREGDDSPSTALAHLTSVFKKYLIEAGVTILSPQNPADDIIEISPLTSYAGEGLSLPPNTSITPPFSI